MKRKIPYFFISLAIFVLSSCAVPAAAPIPASPPPQPVPPPSSVPANIPPSKPSPIPKEVELKYDNGKAREAISYWAGGHIVDFSPPSTPFTVKTIKIAGFLSTREDKEIGNKKFDLEILDKNLKVVYTVTYPYSKFSSAAVNWVNFEIPDVKVDGKFYVHIYTMSPRFGLHIGVDDSVENKHSELSVKDANGNISVVAQWPYGPVSQYWFGDQSKVNWMIRVLGIYLE